MVSWQFFQGLRAEWRWYRLDEDSEVVAESDQAFDELKGCMANAEAAGFRGESYQVHARQSGFVTTELLREVEDTGALVEHVETGERASR
jgi:hypothetical protein